MATESVVHGSAPIVLFHGGSVFDGVRHRPGQGALVGSGRVVAVGPDDQLRDRLLGADPVGPVAETDLAGGLLLPGFQDAHAHPVQGGLERLRCDLSELAGRAEYLAAVADYAARTASGAAEHVDRAGWVTGGGWALTHFGPQGPTAAELDTAVPDRPVFLLNRDHHGAWVNSRALELAGVDERTPDPPDGRVERDAGGRPTGTLHEGAMDLVARHLPPTTQEEYDRALDVGQAYLHSLGITAWQDAILGDYAGMPDFSATYLRAVDDGRLTARVRGALWWDRDRGGEQVAELVDRRERCTRGRFAAGAVKVMQDGIAESFTAAMTIPYRDRCGHVTGNTGLSFVDPQALREHVTALDSHGFQVHVHAIGDRAVREALDAFEAARAAADSEDVAVPAAARRHVAPRRHHIAHLQVVHPDDRPRFAALDVTATVQPLWAHLDEAMVEMTLPYLAPEAARWQYPFADLLRVGARLAAGSDWPVSTPDPLQGIHVAVNRTAHGEEGPAGSEPFLPQQALTLTQALAAYTSGAAYVNHLDDTGRVQPGLRADLAVLDRDPFAGEPGEIGAARVVATYVDGQPVQVDGQPVHVGGGL